MMLERICTVLQSCLSETPHCPPQALFNEQWLLRLVLDWFAAHPLPDHPLTIAPDATWYTGARLRSPFRKRHLGDQLAGKRIGVAGAVGHFDITLKDNRPDLALHGHAQHFTVITARLFKPLGEGIRAARYFDEGARTLAAIAETLRRANRYPVDMDRLGLYILAPESQIKLNVFAEHINRESLRQKTKQRVAAYGKSKKQWYSEWFQPTLEQIALETLSWESILASIQAQDAVVGREFAHFYALCVEFN